MIINDVEYFPVTDDPAMLNALNAKDGILGSVELGRYAVDELGLTPPQMRLDGSVPAIVLVWDMEAGRGYLVWDVHEMPEADPDDDYNPDATGWEGHYGQ
ncbi:hypothetical protein [Glycomyces sp. NPDC048151]|uniref:hypothetical protein n=1 Tax=Glycomyces sp. NPDC048151 TaxID=3364002 RepID=UPI003715761D